MRRARKPKLSLLQGGSTKKSKLPKPGAYNPADNAIGENQDVDLPEDAGTKGGIRGIYEDRGGFSGSRRFTILGSDGGLLRVIEQANELLYSRTQELELYDELREWLDRKDPLASGPQVLE